MLLGNEKIYESQQVVVFYYVFYNNNYVCIRQ